MNQTRRLEPLEWLDVRTAVTAVAWGNFPIPVSPLYVTTVQFSEDGENLKDDFIQINQLAQDSGHHKHQGRQANAKLILNEPKGKG